MTEPLRPPTDVTPQPVETDQQSVTLPTPARLGQPTTGDEPATPQGITISTWPPKENQ